MIPTAKFVLQGKLFFFTYFMLKPREEKQSVFAVNRGKQRRHPS